MSWWDSKGLANFATKALQTAQQHIDKALDIQDQPDEDGNSSMSGGFGTGEDFWDSYLGADSPAPVPKAKQQPGVTQKPSQDVKDKEEDLFASLGTTVDSTALLTQKAKSLQDKFKSSKRTFKSPKTEYESPPANIKSNQSIEGELQNMKQKTANESSVGNNLSPLKFGMKLGGKKKEKPREIPNDETKSAEIEEKIKREREAERQLAEISEDSITKQGAHAAPAKIATLEVSSSEKDNTLNSDAPQAAVSGSGGTTLFDMSGSSIMQDSQCGEWGDDVSLSMLVESTVPDISTTSQIHPKSDIQAHIADNVNQIQDGARIADNVNQIQDSEFVFDNLAHIKERDIDMLDAERLHLEHANLDIPEETDQTIDTKNLADDIFSRTYRDDLISHVDPSVVDSEDSKEINLSESTEVLTENTDEKSVIDAPVICQNTDIDKCEPVMTITREETVTANDDTNKAMLTCDSNESETINDSENIGDENKSSSVTDNVHEDIVIEEGASKDNETPNKSEPIIVEPLLTDSIQSESLMSVPHMDESQASSVDELSSSNRTLTAEDLQSMDNSQCSSTEDKTVAFSNEGIPEEDETHLISSETIKAPSDGEQIEVKNEPQDTDATEESFDAQDSTDGPQTAEKQQKATSDGRQVTASNSDVKCMLEEAMVESVKDSCDSQSYSSSDMVRIESGGNSEHTSADELETATSSDIEIISHISTPTPNGGHGAMERPFELSPLRHYAFIKTAKSPPGHNRTDSGSSGYSKNGDEITQERRLDIDQVPRHHLAQASQVESHEPQSNPYEAEKLLKSENPDECKTLEPIVEKELDPNNALDPNKLLEKLADMAEVLEAREKKLVELSRHNMDLTESNTILRNQLEQSEEAREAELTDLNQLTDEFTQRISEAERKLNSATKERDQLKKQNQDLEGMLTKRSDASSSAQKLLSEKDQQIAELMEEGEKLSKQQLQVNNIIKKLRSKEKENDSVMKSQKERIESQKAEIEKLKKVLDNKCDVETQQSESINQLQSAVQQYEKELERYKLEVEESGDKMRSLQAALDNSYKEIAELHKANVMKASQLQEDKLSSELQAKQDLQIQMERQAIQSKQEHEALLNQIEDLRLSMTRMEKEGGRREDVLRQEISDLQQRLQEAEDRNQELTQGVSAATRPLLRQIENLQSTYTAQSSSYERVEKNLTERLSEAHLGLATAQEKERVASEQLLEVSSKLAAFEAQLVTLRQEKSKLQAQLEMEKTRNEVLEDAKNNSAAQRDALQHSFEQEISQLKRDKLLLENQLEMEKIRVEAEKKKTASITEQLRDKEMQVTTLMSSRSSTPKDGMLRDPETPMLSSVASMSNSMSASFFSTIGEDTMDRSFVLTPGGTSSKSSLYDTLRHTGAATLMENLQAQVKQQDGEIVQLQNEIKELEKSRESMARELVSLSNKNGELSDQLGEYDKLKETYQELEQRYNALLQMYGEKVEEVQELRLDLADVKDLYKSQIDELLGKR